MRKADGYARNRPCVANIFILPLASEPDPDQVQAGAKINFLIPFTLMDELIEMVKNLDMNIICIACSSGVYGNP